VFFLWTAYRLGFAMDVEVFLELPLFFFSFGSTFGMWADGGFTWLEA
jgi:hypothetical protein